jgi:hypothetical protein
MNRTMLSRIGLSALVSVAVAFVGCDDTPKFDPAVQYSADTLAKEFLYGYGELKTVNGSAVRSQAPKGRPEAAAKEAATKGEAATKKAAISTLDDLIGETLRKAALIPGTSTADACKKVVEEVAKDPSIPEPDKKIIADKLGQATH